MSETRTDGLVDISVQAEYAPIGVQLWPTRRPDQSIHFTLRSVAVVRNEVRSWVVWTYEDNHIRTFEIGEMVASRMTPEAAVQVLLPQVVLTLTVDESAAVRDALRLALTGLAPSADTPSRVAEMRRALDRLVEQI